MEELTFQSKEKGITIHKAMKHSSIRTGLKTLLFALCLAAGTTAHAAQPTVQPVLQGKWPASPRGHYAYDVKVVGHYAYVADSTNGLQIIDVTSPTNCVRVGGYATRGPARSVAVAGNYAYVANESYEGLQVIDVSNPANCVRVGGRTNDPGGYASEVAVAGNYAYVADGCAGLQVIDVRNPTNCIRVGGFYNSWCYGGVAVLGKYAYLTSSRAGLHIVDVSDPANCVQVGRYFTDGNAASVAVSGNYAYVTDSYWGGLEVIDVRNPTNCVGVGYYDTGYGTSGRYATRGVAVAGSYVYVAESLVFGNRPLGRLEVIDVSNPTNCVRVGGYDTKGEARGVAVVGGRIYLADGNEGLLVVPTIRDFQFSVRVDATPNLPFTLEAATNLADPNSWQPLLTTNVATMPFDFVDFDVKLTNKPQKFYRVRQ